MSFYSYKNCNSDLCPGRIAGDCTRGLDERVCVQVKKIYDSCIQQEQLDDQEIAVTCLTAVDCTEPSPAILPPIEFCSCRSASTEGVICNLCIERLCDKPNFARVRADVDIPLDILFIDANCREGIAKGTLTVAKDVLMFIPDDSIVPFTLESLVSAICVKGEYIGNNKFKITVCVTIILKILAEVELLVPTYGFCPIPPCEEFAENVCDEFFSLPIFPTHPCDVVGATPPGTPVPICTPASTSSASCVSTAGRACGTRKNFKSSCACGR